MILQALKEYYDRKLENQVEGEGAPPIGFENKELPFLIVIDNNGEFLFLQDTRDNEESGKKGKKYLLPRSKGRTNAISKDTTFLLWDNVGYVLGMARGDDKNSVTRAAKQHKAWLDMLHSLPSELIRDDGVQAVIQFYEKNGVPNVFSAEMSDELQKIPGCNISFRLKSDIIPVPCRNVVVNYQKQLLEEELSNESELGTCLVTGERGVIARIHGKTPINKDSNSLVGFQKNSGYDSYGKEQGFNAPISKSTEFAYVTALNNLLKSRDQHIVVGEIHTVFWSRKEDKLEKRFSSIFLEPEIDDPDSGLSPVKELFKSIESGAYIGSKGKVPCYILGLSPSSARISIRYWEELDLERFSKRIRQYFEDFSIVAKPNEPEFYSSQEILRKISSEDKVENIRPGLSGEFMRSILTGSAFPVTMLQSTLARIRNDVKFRANRVRAASLKAYLNRYYRFNISNGNKMITMNLDEDQPSVGYQLGRLFATLERVQEAANRGLNTTITEKYYATASTSPVAVFPTLLKLKNYHLSKLNQRGTVVYFEQILGEIMGKLDNMPDHLNLHEQAFFSVGYYHQKQYFYTKRDKNKEDAEVEQTIEGDVN